MLRTFHTQRNLKPSSVGLQTQKTPLNSFGSVASTMTKTNRAAKLWKTCLVSRQSVCNSLEASDVFSGAQSSTLDVDCNLQICLNSVCFLCFQMSGAGSKVKTADVKEMGLVSVDCRDLQPVANRLVVSRDGSHLFAALDFGSIRIMPFPPNGNVCKEFTVHKGDVKHLCLHHSGHQI